MNSSEQENNENIVGIYQKETMKPIGYVDIDLEIQHKKITIQDEHIKKSFDIRLFINKEDEIMQVVLVEDIEEARKWFKGFSLIM